MALLIDTDPPALPPLAPDHVVAAITSLGQRQYMSGWRWGVVCGLVTGVCTTALGGLLAYTAWQAWP